MGLEDVKMKKIIRRVVKKGMTCFDVGAHLGNYSILFSSLVGNEGRVFAFEPTKGSFEKLTSNLLKNNCMNVILINKAVYSRNCEVILQQFSNEGKLSSLNTLGHPRMIYDRNKVYPIEKSVEVEAITLDSFCQENHIDRIDYLKSDVEGAEFEVLKGSSKLLENKSIRYVQFEVSRVMLEGMNTTIKPVFDFLNFKNYECHFVAANGIISVEVFNSSTFIDNFIAFPKKD